MRYNLDEDPRKMEHHASKDLMNSKYSASALGGKDGKVVALASGRHIFFHAVGEGTGKQIESVGAAHGSSGTLVLSMLVRMCGVGLQGVYVEQPCRGYSLSCTKRALDD